MALYLTYSIAWLVGWFISTQLESVVNLASIFLPAGIRVAFLLLTRKRMWIIIILAEISVAIAISVYFGRFNSTIEMVVASSTPILIYASAIIVYQRLINASKEDVDRFILLFLSIGVAAILNSSVLILNSIYCNKMNVDFPRVLWAAFALGDVIGVLLVTPTIILTLNRRHMNLEGIEVKLSLVIGSILSAIAIAVTLYLMPDALSYIKLLMFGIMILVAYHYGWLTVLLTAWLTTILLSLYNSFLTPEIDVLEDQIFIITLSLTGFLLSFSLLEKQKNMNKLIAQNKELLVNKKKLKEELAQNQALANKLVVAQEIERMHISRELHDEVGQNITALKTNIRVVQTMSKDKKIQVVADIVYDLADSIYKISYDIMYRLRPVTLNQLGLSKSIQTSAFTNTLKVTGISYKVSLCADVEKIGEHAQSSIYRIIQETMNNAVKYSKATSFNVALRHKRERLFLHIWDDGVGFDLSKQKRGVGISGIQERVYALNGKLKLKSGAEGTQYHISMSR